jgi:hypothetical protein
LKVNKLINLLTKGKFFELNVYHIYSVEWQYRGLPHAHILLWSQKDQC